MYFVLRFIEVKYTVSASSFEYLIQTIEYMYVRFWLLDTFLKEIDTFKLTE